MTFLAFGLLCVFVFVACGTVVYGWLWGGILCVFRDFFVLIDSLESLMLGV